MRHIALALIVLALPLCVSAQDFGSADKDLNEVYQAVLRSYLHDKNFVRKLRVAQQAWLKFRDAQLEALYPASDKEAAYGSVYPMCAGKVLAELTKARIAQLRAWLDGVEEGEVCSGSVRRKSKK